MDQPNKLPLVKASLQLLVEELGENDRIAIVVYAGASGLVLPIDLLLEEGRDPLGASTSSRPAARPTAGRASSSPTSRPSTTSSRAASNRVILATDGDFNVGITNRDELIKLIEAKRKSGVFLSVLGFGMGNLKDSQLEQLADKGNGHYAYIDSLEEAEKVLVKEMGATLVTIAKDVKIQVEFNPAKVAAYRLIGYENRLLAGQDFTDDAKDAGEIGAGHHVTALYELVPAGKEVAFAKDAELEFQKSRRSSPAPDSLLVKVRYKRPDEETSRLFKRGRRRPWPGLLPVLNRLQVRLGRRRLRHAAATFALQGKPDLPGRPRDRRLLPQRRPVRLPQGVRRPGQKSPIAGGQRRPLTLSTTLPPHPPRRPPVETQAGAFSLHSAVANGQKTTLSWACLETRRLDDNEGR